VTAALDCIVASKPAMVARLTQAIAKAGNQLDIIVYLQLRINCAFQIFVDSST